MARHIAFRVAVGLSAVGSLLVACSSAPDSDDSSAAIGQALQRVGTDPPLKEHDAGHDSGHDAGHDSAIGPVKPLPIPAPFWATECTTTRYFVRRDLTANGTPSPCADVDSLTGKWSGSSLFPDAPATPQCVYTWSPDVAHALPVTFDFDALQNVAAITRHNAPDVKPECSVTTCGADPVSCVDVPINPPCDPDAGPDGGCPHGHIETGPICESCAVVHNGALMVVLPPMFGSPTKFLATPEDKAGLEFTAPLDTQTFRVPFPPGYFPENAVVDLTHPLGG